MRLVFRALLTGFLVAAIGLVLVLLPIGQTLEERFGLDVLFTLRGVRTPPKDVVVVGIDKTSADHMGLSEDLRKWPRSLHARLVELLRQRRASVIVFDTMFEEGHSKQEDLSFAKAVSRAGNVVLSCYLKSVNVQEDDTAEKSSRPGEKAKLMRVALPLSTLCGTAAGIAPFPLPKVPQKISQYWTFKPEAGDMPTLPVVALHIFALDAIHELEKLTEQTGSVPDDLFSKGPKETVRYERVVARIRATCENNKHRLDRFLEEVARRRGKSLSENAYRKLSALAVMYQAPSMPYLNFYGPPQTIKTIPYHRIFPMAPPGSDNLTDYDFADKAVFIGHSTKHQDQQKEGFFTVFSDSSGLDLSGVEIAATGFANLLDNSAVRLVPPRRMTLILIIWGMVLGFICLLLPTGLSAIAVIGFSLCLLFAAQLCFTRNYIWSPLAIPLFIQAPCAFLTALVIKYMGVKQERENIRKALEYYLPNQLVKDLVKNIAALKSSHQLVYGICLWTDAEQYTSLSEKLDPSELARYMNRYFETVFNPVRRHGGVVSNVVADSMLAVWVSPGPDASLRTKACRAALDIADALHNFNRHSSTRLPTRIGLHSGHILLSNIGAIDHYEYRPIGDIVNGATRIEGVGKLLGASILVSDEALTGVEGMQTREVGTFVVVGKSTPLRLYQLMCRAEEATSGQQEACLVFARALTAFRARDWEEAIKFFTRARSALGSDSVSSYYINLCSQYQQQSPPDQWDGTIYVDRK